MPREFVLLQGTGCRWRRCEFCDYHSDVSDDPFEVNRQVLEQVTGEYGVLDPLAKTADNPARQRSNHQEYTPNTPIAPKATTKSKQQQIIKTCLSNHITM